MDPGSGDAFALWRQTFGHEAGQFGVQQRSGANATLGEPVSLRR